MVVSAFQEEGTAWLAFVVQGHAQPCIGFAHRVRYDDISKRRLDLIRFPEEWYNHTL